MQIAPQIHAVFQALGQLPQVAGEEIDAVGVVDGPVQINAVIAGQAVFRDVDGAGVALVHIQDAEVHHLRGDLPLGRGEGEARGDGGLAPVLLHRVALVDVDAYEIRLFHFVPVRLGDLRGEILHHLGGAFGVAAEEQGVQEHVHAEHPVSGVKGGVVGGLTARGGIHPWVAQAAAGGQAHHRAGGSPANLPGGLAVGQTEVEVAFQRLGLTQLPAGGVDAGDVAQGGDALGLVQGHVGIHPSGEMLRHHGGVPAEGSHDVPVQPAALVLKGAGQVPMVQGNHGLDAIFQQRVHQAVIIGKALLVYSAVPVGDDAGPAEGEAVGLNAVRLHQGHVLRAAVVAVAGGVAGVAVIDVAGDMGEFVPDAQALAVLIPAALALIGGAGHAPQEILGEHHTLTSTLYSFLPVSGITLPGRISPSTVRL